MISQRARRYLLLYISHHKLQALTPTLTLYSSITMSYFMVLHQKYFFCLVHRRYIADSNVAVPVMDIDDVFNDWAWSLITNHDTNKPISPLSVETGVFGALIQLSQSCFAALPTFWCQKQQTYGYYQIHNELIEYLLNLMKLMKLNITNIVFVLF